MLVAGNTMILLLSLELLLVSLPFPLRYFHLSHHHSSMGFFEALLLNVVAFSQALCFFFPTNFIYLNNCESLHSPHL